MIHESLLSRQPGTEARWYYDDVTGECHVQTSTEVGGMIERNQEAYKNWNDASRMGDLVRVGSLPLAKYFKLQKAGIINDDPRQLNFWKWARANYHEYSKWFAVPYRVLS